MKRRLLNHVSHLVPLSCICRCSNHPVPKPSARVLPLSAPLYHACVSHTNLSSQLAAVGQGPTTTLLWLSLLGLSTIRNAHHRPSHSPVRGPLSPYDALQALLLCSVPVCCACICPDVARAPTNSTRHSANALLSSTARPLHPPNASPTRIA
jgi:hypothetical protein